MTSALLAGPSTPAGPGPTGSRSRRARRATPRNTLTRGQALGLGVTMMWFSLLVLIPLTAVVAAAAAGGWDRYFSVLTNSQTWAAVTLTVTQALMVTAVNVVMGTIIAWVLVRDHFPGKAVVNVIIDVPFALPTIVAGLVLLSLYGPNSPLGLHWAFTERAVTLALAFVTLPFVVRTVQPVLEELEPEVEEVAAVLGATRRQTVLRVVVPAVTPALLTGFALAFARAIGEYGSVVFISGNKQLETEITPLLIMTRLEQFDYAGATALGLVMLTVSFAMLLAINGLGAWARRRAGHA
jgi:sulfate transport system permease protein